MKCGYKECNHKIPLSLQYACKCGLIYCRYHNHFHSCTFDYKEEQRKKLEKEHPKVINDKINKI